MFLTFQSLFIPGETLLDFIENEIKRLDAEDESGDLGLEVTSRISMAAAEESAVYYNSINDADGSMVGDSHGGISSDNGSSAYVYKNISSRGLDGDEFDQSSSTGTSFEFFSPSQREAKIMNAVDGKDSYMHICIDMYNIMR